MADTTASAQARPKEVYNAIQHIEIVSTEPEKFRAFCEKRFGWQFEAFPMDEGSYHMFRTPDGNGGGVVAPQGGQPVAATPYINVDDLEKTLKDCEADGAKIIMPITEVPNMGRFFWFQVAGGPPLACWQSIAGQS